MKTLQQIVKESNESSKELLYLSGADIPKVVKYINEKFTSDDKKILRLVIWEDSKNEVPDPIKPVPQLKIKKPLLPPRVAQKRDQAEREQKDNLNKQLIAQIQTLINQNKAILGKTSQVRPVRESISAEDIKYLLRDAITYHKILSSR